MAEASAAIAVAESPTMAPTTITTSGSSTTIASLPREIRDKIYGLVLPHSQTLDFRSIQPMLLISPIPQTGNCRILATYASGYGFAREACMMFFQNNTIRVSEEHLPKILSEGPFTELASCYMYFSHPCAVPMIQFDLKAWIGRITVILNNEQGMDGLDQRVGLLLDCPALWEVGVFIWKYPRPLQRVIGSISNAFKPLEESGCRLQIRVVCYQSMSFPPSQDLWCGEHVFGNLKELEDAIRDEESDL